MVCECYIPGSEWYKISTNLDNEYIAWGPFWVLTVIIFCSLRIFYKKMRLLRPGIILQEILNLSSEISHMILCKTTLREETIFVWIELEHTTQLIYHLYDTTSTQQKHDSWDFWQ